MLRATLLLSVLAAGAVAHEVSTGECPDFPDMKGFDWDRVIKSNKPLRR